MLVYNDIITGDQLLSDSYKQEPLVYNDETIEGVFIVRSKNSTKGGIVLEGENPSAEGGDDGGDDAEVVNNMIDGECGFGYNVGPKMSGKEFVAGIFKPWCKAVKEAIAAKGDAPKPFMKSVKGAVKFVQKEYKNMEIYHGNGANAERNDKSYTDSFILAWWDDAANASGCPTFVFFKHALLEEKY